MARLQYFVLNHEGEWVVGLGGQHFGPFPSQDHALAAAVEGAHQAHAAGRETEVFVQAVDGEFRAEWTSGKDPYPPK